jgi:hypothetical protein
MTATPKIKKRGSLFVETKRTFEKKRIEIKIKPSKRAFIAYQPSKFDTGRVFI